MYRLTKKFSFLIIVLALGILKKPFRVCWFCLTQMYCFSLVFCWSPGFPAIFLLHLCITWSCNWEQQNSRTRECTAIFMRDLLEASQVAVLQLGKPTILGVGGAWGSKQFRVWKEDDQNGKLLQRGDPRNPKK